MLPRLGSRRNCSFAVWRSEQRDWPLGKGARGCSKWRRRGEGDCEKVMLGLCWFRSECCYCCVELWGGGERVVKMSLVLRKLKGLVFIEFFFVLK